MAFRTKSKGRISVDVDPYYFGDNNYHVMFQDAKGISELSRASSSLKAHQRAVHFNEMLKQGKHLKADKSVK